MKRSKQWRGFGPLVRAVAVVGAVGVITTGVTFAALQSQQAVLTGNTIESATADLRIGTSATSFAASRGGFDFSGIVPGTAPAPAAGNSMYLKNYGSALLAVKASLANSPSNPGNIDLSKVMLDVVRVDTGTDQELALSALVNGGASLTDSLAVGAVAQYKLKVSMTADAFAGNSANLGSFDLVFTGTGTN